MKSPFLQLESNRVAHNGLAISSSVQTSLLFSFYSANLANKPEFSPFKPKPELLLIAIVVHSILFSACHSEFNFYCQLRKSQIILFSFNRVCFQSVIQSSAFPHCFHTAIQSQFQLIFQNLVQSLFP
jgi:hypothetical protein